MILNLLNYCIPPRHRLIGQTKTHCLSAPAKSTPESFPEKIWSVKSLPGKKRLDFLSPLQYDPCDITHTL